MLCEVAARTSPVIQASEVALSIYLLDLHVGENEYSGGRLLPRSAEACRGLLDARCRAGDRDEALLGLRGSANQSIGRKGQASS